MTHPVTILMRLEKPHVTLTVCGMISQKWLDGLVDGSIARGQGGLTRGQLAWRDIHLQNSQAAPGQDPDDRAARPARPIARRQPGRRASRSRRTDAPFDPVDTEEI